MKPLRGLYKSCLFCLKLFYIKKYRLNTALYCSRSCKALYTRVQISTKCKICNKYFNHISSRCNKAKYCSSKCYHQSQKGRGSKEYECRHCGNKFFDSASRNRIYCSKKCVNKNHREIFKPKYTTVRKKMLAENMIKECEKCGYNTVKEILGIHHKDGNRKNNIKNNLQILCPLCHSLIHRKHIPH